MKLTSPKSLVLPPEHIALILDCLAEGKFRDVSPVIESVMRQIEEQNVKVESCETIKVDEHGQQCV